MCIICITYHLFHHKITSDIPFITDNVHFQHSAQFIKALTSADVDFRMQLYTDKNHALSGAHTSNHLYRTMTKFLINECWDGGEPRDLKPVEKKSTGKS
jgi:dipeptidyl-peptidase-4